MRLELLCGERALRALAASWEQNLRIGQALSVKGEKTFAAVERLRGELGETKAQLAAMEEERFREIAAQQAGRGDVLLIEPAMRPESVRRLCDAAAQVCGGALRRLRGRGRRVSLRGHPTRAGAPRTVKEHERGAPGPRRRTRRLRAGERLLHRGGHPRLFRRTVIHMLRAAK